MRQNLVIGLSISFIFILGIWGQYDVSPDNLGERFSHAFYEIVLLFAFAGEWTLDISPLPWQIEVARLIAPAATLMTLLFVFAEEARVELINFMVRYRNDHIIVGGLGRRAWQFIQTCDNPRKLVAVERNPDSPFVERARQRGISVIIGDVLDAGIYEKIGLRRAKDLVAFTGSDGTNVDLALKARDFVRTHPPNIHLRIHLHADEPKLADRLQDYPKFYAEYSLAEISFFSVYDLSARILFQSYPPDLYADVFGQRQVHIALFTFEGMARHILLEAARMCHFRNSSRTRFTIFDKDAAARQKELQNEYPHVREICDIDFVQLEVNGQHDIDELSTLLLQSITYHVICDDSDEDNLNCSLILRDALLKRKGCNAPIMVRMQQSSGLAQLLESRTGGPENPDGLYPYGMLDQVLEQDNIINARLDRLAKIIHRIYEEPSDLTDQITHQSTQQDWSELREFKRKQNRLQADHLEVKLRAIRCSAREESSPGFTFSAQEAELLAMMEHERWFATQKNDGWVLGPEKVEDAKINPDMVPWELLNDAVKESEIRRMRIYPTFFAKQAELQHLCRQLVIGVTGHRLHKLDIDNAALIKAIGDLLLRLERKHRDRKIIIMSPLAEGADRLVAKMAMEKIGAELWVPLPLPFDLYSADFSTDESVEEFKILVGKAKYYFELPMKFGSQAELAIRQDRSSELRNQQYALAGAYIVERSDELIAIWDGEPEEGTGGTAQVVRWRREGRVDPEYANNSDFFQLPVMTEPLVIPPQP